jgi:hypothetical protein
MTYEVHDWSHAHLGAHRVQHGYNTGMDLRTQFQQGIERRGRKAGRAA